MTSAGASARSGSAGLSIGAVLARLKQEFPDLSISKIRFLESEDLVTPERTGAGYRQFSPADVERLRYILTAQRDHYLPLKVIKEQLEARDRGDDAPFGGAGFIGGALPRPLAAVIDNVTRPTGANEVRIGRGALCEEAGLTPPQLAQAEEFGLVIPDAAGHYDGDALLAARTVADLLALGVEPRHLRSLRTTAEREATIVAQIVAPAARKRDVGARQRATADAASHAATLLRLHALLVKSALERELGT